MKEVLNGIIIVFIEPQVDIIHLIDVMKTHVMKFSVGNILKKLEILIDLLELFVSIDKW